MKRVQPAPRHNGKAARSGADMPDPLAVGAEIRFHHAYGDHWSTGEITRLAIVAAIPMGFLISAIIVVNNLAPAMLRGESSNGMLLAATSGDKVIVLTADDPTCVPGAKIK